MYSDGKWKKQMVYKEDKKKQRFDMEAAYAETILLSRS